MNDTDNDFNDSQTSIEVEQPSNPICGNVREVCHPESFFEMIEQCKICGRCV